MRQTCETCRFCGDGVSATESLAGPTCIRDDRYWHPVDLSNHCNYWQGVEDEAVQQVRQDEAAE